MSPDTHYPPQAQCDNDSGLTTGTSDLSVLVVSLLKGVIYKENDPLLWNSLLKLQPRVRDYVAVLGVEMTLDEAEGFAFLRTKPEPAEAVISAAASVRSIAATTDPLPLSQTKTPRLMARRQLSFPVSLLLALLRKKLAEFDARGGDTRLVLSRDEILELLRVFLPASTNDIRLTTQVDAHLNKIAEMGFIRRLKSQSSRDDTFEVKRILKSFVDAQWLSDFDAQLATYQAHIGGAQPDATGESDNA